MKHEQNPINDSNGMVIYNDASIRSMKHEQNPINDSNGMVIYNEQA